MENIDRVRDELRSLPAYQNRLQGIQAQIRKKEADVGALLRRYEAESRDVEKMRDESFSVFALRLIGKYEDKLDKEQQEEIAAKNAYDEAAADLEELRYEEREAQRHISELEQKARDYEAELNSRKEELRRRLSQPDGQRYRQLENERHELLSQVTEVGEASRVATRAAGTVRTAQESLRKAEDWATYDLFAKGGIISHMAKYDHVDSAQESFHRLRSQLLELQRELADVHELRSPQLSEISSGQRTVDFWFDNIFTDLSVRSQIKDNAAQAEQVRQDIDRVQSLLQSKLRDLNAQLAANKQQEEELLLHMR